MMSKQFARKRVVLLRNNITKHNHLYYNKTSPVISDEDYDKLVRELDKLETDYPELKVTDSPTNTVGAPVPKSLRVKHLSKMYSLDNVFSVPELREWAQKQSLVKMVAEPKYDGLAVSLVYKGGTLHKAISRGDGIEGENITLNVSRVRGVRLRLKGEFYSGKDSLLEIRGEVHMPKADFVEATVRTSVLGGKKMKDPRNTAAGTLRRHNPTEESLGALRFTPYAVGLSKPELPSRDYEAVHSHLMSIGQDIMLYRLIDAVSTEENMDQCFTNDGFPYYTDGIVFKCFYDKDQQRLGYTGKYPKWAIALKFPEKEQESIVEDVQPQVGRTGTITPVAAIKSVRIGNVDVSRATLHNYAEVKRLGIAMGDRVAIIRAGSVIPKILRVVEEGKGRIPIKPPTECPSCGGEVVLEEDWRSCTCISGTSCPAQLHRGLMHFVKRDAMDIVGLGDKTLKLLLDTDYIKSPVSLYKLAEKKPFGGKLWDNLYKSIKNSTHPPLHKFLYSLGVLHLGRTVAGTLCRTFKTLKEIRTASIGSLLAIDDIGPYTAESIHKFFNSVPGNKLVDDLLEAGVVPENVLWENEGVSDLKGVTVVITGSFEGINRKEATEIIQKRGGKVSSSVSKRTAAVFAGSKPGSKVEKAKTLKIPIYPESELVALLQGSDLT